MENLSEVSGLFQESGFSDTHKTEYERALVWS